MTVIYDRETGVPGVRLAVPADEAQIFTLLLMLHGEMGLFNVNHDKVLAGIRWATERKGGLIFCIDEGPRIVATMAMTIACEWYSDDEYLLERWNFVHPQHRKSDYARKLLEQSKWASEWFSRENKKNVPVMVGINSFERLEAKVRLYARHFPCFGAYFLYGETPLMGEKVRSEMRQINELNKKLSGQPSPAHRQVRPIVETILRASSKWEEDHVR